MVILDGNHLTVEDIVSVGVGDKKVLLDQKAIERCIESRAFLEKKIKEREIIYGVNTSFGPMCNKIIEDNEIEQLQENLIISHAAGLGDPFKPYIARAVLLVRLNTLLKGYSGVRIELLTLLKDMINAGIAPYIPECGSVGASGDLVHLSHAALAIIGRGKVYLNDELMDVEKAFLITGLKSLKLSYKEGLALINGTSAMTALSAFVIFSTKKLLNISCVTAAFAAEIFAGINDAYDEDLQLLRPHTGQLEIAKIIRMLYSGSENIILRENIHEAVRSQSSGDSVFETSVEVQNVYSIRCTPQILAPVYETLQSALKTIEIEANSTNDNPIIIPNSDKIVHGGNFHGQSIAFAMDTLGMAVSVLCNLSERRIDKLLNKSLNNGLPEFLISGIPGLEMGFMGAQYLATSTTAENRHLANPINIHSISCNASNQDVVSMGTIAARKAFKIVSNAKHILTLEILCDLQALNLRKQKKMGKGSEKIFQILSEHFFVYDNKRVFHDDLVKFRKLLFSTQIFDDIKKYC